MILIGISLIAAVVVTTLTARWITHPILELNRASRALAAGQWSQKVALNRQDEVGELAHSFNTMAQQQQALIASLQTNETRFRAIFESSVDAIGVSKAGQYVAVNPAYLKMFGYDSLEEINARSTRKGEIGSYKVEMLGTREAKLVRENPYPCDFDYGLIYSTARLFVPAGNGLTVIHDDHTSCRKRGDDSCTYYVHW